LRFGNELSLRNAKRVKIVVETYVIVFNIFYIVYTYDTYRRASISNYIGHIFKTR